MSSFSLLLRSLPPGGFLLFAAALAAGESGPPLTLTETLRRAAENSPTLAALRFDERAADGLVAQAAFQPNPTLDVSLENFLGTGGVQGVRRLEATVQASQTLERGGKRQKRVTLATRERDVAVAGFAVRQAEVQAAAAEAYVELLAAQERLALAAEPLQLARETLTAVEGRVTAGAASPAEAARARAALATAQGELVRTQAALHAARAKLAATWGGTPADVTTVAGQVRLPAPSPDDAALAAGLAHHPSLALHQAVIASQRAALELEQAQSAQDVSIGGGLRFLREGSDAAFVAGVSVPLPVRHRNQGGIRAARERLAGAEQSRRAAESDLRLRFAAAWRELRAAWSTAANLRDAVLPATVEAHTIVRDAYAAGQLPLLDVLDAQRALVAVRRELLEAEAAGLAAFVRAESLANPALPLTTTALSQP